MGLSVGLLNELGRLGAGERGAGAQHDSDCLLACSCALAAPRRPSAADGRGALRAVHARGGGDGSGKPQRKENCTISIPTLYVGYLGSESRMVEAAETLNEDPSVERKLGPGPILTATAKSLASLIVCGALRHMSAVSTRCCHRYFYTMCVLVS